MKLLENMIDWIAGRAASLTAHQRVSLSARLRDAKDKPGRGFAAPLKTFVGGPDGDFADLGAQLVVVPNTDTFIIALDRDGLCQDAMPSDLSHIAIERHAGSFRIYLSGDLDDSCGVIITYEDGGRIAIDGKFEDVSQD